MDSLPHLASALGNSPFGRRHAAPVATYRLQLSKDFDLAATQRVLPYLARLGISHLYVSPLTQARPGSSHGYDVTDHTVLNPEIGEATALASLSDALAALDMGMILDFVPNHMGIGNDNKWWQDVLEWGAASPYAPFFDIDWRPSKRELIGKVLVPILGDHYGAALERGQLALRFSPEDGTFSVWYFDNRLPVRPSHYGIIIRRALADIPCRPDQAARLRDLADAFAKLRTEGLSRRRQLEVHEQADHLKSELAKFACSSDADAWLQRGVAIFNGTPGQPRTFRLLHALLERQYYRLAYWRVAANEINYRRFFDINGLIGIRQEEQEVFHQTHRLIGEMVERDWIQGLRIDHVDGLFDPAGYCRALRRLIETKKATTGADGQIHSPDANACFPIYVEKILGRHETLRADWPIDGTTGYDFLALLNRIFIRPDSAKTIDAAFHAFAGEVPSFEAVLYDSKRLVMDTLLASELEVLADTLDRLAEQNWSTRDYTRERLRRAIIETVAHFSVYRTYVTAAACSTDDRKIIEMAISRAKRHWSGPDLEILDFLQSALTLDLVKNRRSGYNRNDVVQFAMRFQQFCSPVMAKGLEDTAGYRYPRFLSLNEVGSEPSLFYVPIGVFHSANEERRRLWPNTMLATATHDTKRGEDVRARLNVLSELSDWESVVRRWRRFNRRWRTEVDGQRTPSLADEYMIYQTLLGAWPVHLADTGSGRFDKLNQFRERVKGFVTKAVREAKLISSWSSPNEAYERNCLNFVDAILDDRKRNLFLDDIGRFAERVAFLGALNGLSQVVLKCTVPGVPDIYQGAELWDLNLVDPDNRRLVDFGLRASILDQFTDGVRKIEAADAVAHLVQNWQSGEIKLYVLRRLLMLRNFVPELFRTGSYEPLSVDGDHSDHVIAFARRHAQGIVVVAAGRWFDQILRQGTTDYPDNARWNHCMIEADDLGEVSFMDSFTGRHVQYKLQHGTKAFAVENLFSTLPVAVLTAMPSP